jgi:hypothetical protein
MFFFSGITKINRSSKIFQFNIKQRANPWVFGSSVSIVVELLPRIVSNSRQKIKKMMFRFIMVAAVVATSCVTGFQQHQRVVFGRLSNLGQRNMAQFSSPTALKASTATMAPTSSSPSILQKFLAASLKKKLVFLAHPVAIIAVAWLLKSVVEALLPIIASTIKKLKGTMGFKAVKSISVDDNTGKRFYGIAKPIKNPKAAPLLTLPVQKPSMPAINRSTPAPAPKKQTADANASVAQAKARVVSILAALDEATVKASKKVVEVQSKSIVSFNSIMGVDAEKAGRDAYLAKVRMQEKERAAKVAKAKALEMAALAAQERVAKIAAKDAEARKKSEELLAMKRQQEDEKKALLQAEALERKRRVEEAYILALQKAQAEEKKQEVVFKVMSTTKSGWSPHCMAAKA